MKKALTFLFFLLMPLAGVLGQTQTPPIDAQRIAPDPSKNFSYPYYFYVPAELRAAEAKPQKHTVLVLPNNTGKLSDDFAVHEANVKRRIAQAPAIASMLKVVVLIPVFPRPETDWRIYTHALDRDSMVTEKKGYRRLDLQLIAMIDDARSRLSTENLRIEKRVLISGFSAQGMFANRFTFLHPDRVKAAAIGSPGGWPIIPVERFDDKDLRYPIGIADFRLISGKKLDLKALRRVPLFIFMGDRDDNDSVVFGDSYDDQDRDLIIPLFGKMPVDRWEIARSLYAKAGLNAEFKLYPGVAHTVTLPMRDDIRAFLLKHK